MLFRSENVEAEYKVAFDKLAEAELSEAEDIEAVTYNQYKLDVANLQMEMDHEIRHIDRLEEVSRQRNSYIGRVGVFFEPIFKPLGFNWKINVALISGISAKEIVISTLGVLYSDETIEDPTSEEETLTLAEKLKDVNAATGKPDFTPLVAFSFIIFVLIYFPCIATIASIVNESGSVKWGVFTVVYTCALAWFVAFLIYQIGSLLT